MPQPTDSRSISRRDLLQAGVAIGVGALASGALAAGPASPTTLPATMPSRIVRMAAIGTSRNSKGGDGRGTGVAKGFAALPGVEMVYVCDVDERAAANASASVGKVAAKPPRPVKDLREVLDDKTIDAVYIATPNHWHTPAALLAMAAGKHVYVEKPCSQNAAEGEMLVASAQKRRKHVQHGTQRRSWPGIREAMERLAAGDIGRVLSAKCYYFNSRPTIGQGKPAEVPSWLDWSLWQGPATEVDFRDNYVHYNWHWFWHWGNGELGNNGVHHLDLCRWGMGVDHPSRVTMTGGKYRFIDDDQQTPDTSIAAFEYPDNELITWENRSWSGKSGVDPDHEVAFYGEKGTLVIRGVGYTIYDMAGKETSTGTGKGGDADHLQNFVDAVRDDKKLNAPISEGNKSTHMCHLGNIAWRAGRMLKTDPKTGAIIDAPDAQKLWTREYRKGWEPVV